MSFRHIQPARPSNEDSVRSCADVNSANGRLTGNRQFVHIAPCSDASIALWLGFERSWLAPAFVAAVGIAFVVELDSV